jgi:hypothetical protein
LSFFQFDLHGLQSEWFGRILTGFTALKSLDLERTNFFGTFLSTVLRRISEGMLGLEALDISANDIDIFSATYIREMLINGNLLRLDMNRTSMDSVCFDQIVDGCCLSPSIGVVKTESVENIAGHVDSRLLALFKEGKLKLFEFKFCKLGGTELN